MSLQQNFPMVGGPVLDQKGNFTQSWLAFFRTLWDRTGQGAGLSTDDVAVLSLAARGGLGGIDRKARSLAQDAMLLALFASQRKPQIAASSVTINVTASEAISAGALVNVYLSGGAMRVRNADASDPTKFANGFVLVGIANGASGVVQFFGFNSAVTVATGQSEVWLSDVTPGAYMLTPPASGSGHLNQTVGTAVLGLGLAFQQGTYTIV